MTENNEEIKKELTPEQKEKILNDKKAIFEDTGITVERQDELSELITKSTMNYLKTQFTSNKIDSNIERAFVCYTLKEKLEWLTTLYYLGSVEVNKKEGEQEDGRKSE